MRKLSIVHVMPVDGVIRTEDLERWRKIFQDRSMTDDEAMATGEVVVEYIPQPGDRKTITLVKIGGPGYHPSYQELEQFREVFEAASKDDDFKVFTAVPISIDVIDIGEVVAVE